MMIAHIDILLCRWGRWAVAQASREVGYPSVCPMFRDVGSGAYGSKEPAGLGDVDVIEVDKAVRALPDVLRATVVTHYQHAKSFRESAARCGIRRGLLNRFLSDSHIFIDRWLSGSQNTSNPDSFHSCLQDPTR